MLITSKRSDTTSPNLLALHWRTVATPLSKKLRKRLKWSPGGAKSITNKTKVVNYKYEQNIIIILAEISFVNFEIEYIVCHDFVKNVLTS